MALEVNSWDTAIRKAKLRIKELELAIQTFEAKKEANDPWPDSDSYTVTQEAVTAVELLPA